MILDELLKYSGRIVSVGDTFDHKRSSVEDESIEDYLERTSPWWKHIEHFVHGNHDAVFLKVNSQLKSSEFYKEGNVLALHGHQLSYNFDYKKIDLVEASWFVRKSKFSLFWEIEEFFVNNLNKLFQVKGWLARTYAKVCLKRIMKQGLLDANTNVVIMGHTHLPFDVLVEFQGKTFRVINLGSTLKKCKWNPVYIPEIDKLFISDLHIGTNKSRLN